jgi:hypothetical protein
VSPAPFSQRIGAVRGVVTGCGVAGSFGAGAGGTVLRLERREVETTGLKALFGCTERRLGELERRIAELEDAASGE